MRAVALAASILFHILSAATVAALASLFVGNLAAGAVTLVALAALEFSKRETSGKFFDDALQFSHLKRGNRRVYLEQPDCEGGTFIYQSREEAEIFQRHLEKCCAGTNPERCFFTCNKSRSVPT